MYNKYEKTLTIEIKTDTIHTKNDGSEKFLDQWSSNESNGDQWFGPRDISSKENTSLSPSR